MLEMCPVLDAVKNAGLRQIVTSEQAVVSLMCRDESGVI